MSLDQAGSCISQEAEPAKLRRFDRTASPTGRERMLAENELIVSKTDLKGVITYANATFLRIAGMTEEEALGAPHSIIRHPDMPRCVFKLLWDRIAAGHEVFAYVVNLAKNGDHYWVLAHVTPSYDAHGRLIAYHSNRRRPARSAIEAVLPLYADLCRIEAQGRSKPAGCEAALAHMLKLLDDKGVSYDEFFFSL